VSQRDTPVSQRDTDHFAVQRTPRQTLRNEKIFASP